MPKKTARQQSRTKNRARRAPPARSQVALGEAPPAGADVMVAPAPVATADLAAPARPATRRPAVARRTPTISFNYAYLRRDLKALMVLAPMMVILVIVAFLTLH